MSARRSVLVAALTLLVATAYASLLWRTRAPVDRPVAPAVSSSTGPPAAEEWPVTGAVTPAPEQLTAIDPDRDPQQWVEAVDTFRARLERFAGSPELDPASRRAEGEELLRWVDALAAKRFYLPGQRNQVKLEIARRIYADDPPVLAERTRQYEADALREMQDFSQEQRRESLDDTRFQSLKAQEAALIDRMVKDLPPGPERDAAIARAVGELRRRSYGGPDGP